MKGIGESASERVLEISDEDKDERRGKCKRPEKYAPTRGKSGLESGMSPSSTTQSE